MKYDDLRKRWKQSRAAFYAVAIFCGGTANCVWGSDFPQPVNTEKLPGQAMSADEVCRSVDLPPGFHLSVFASEPDVQNPMAITTDDSGRLWVAENYTWAGQDAGNFDTNLRDRVVIFEDSNGDGKFDKRKVFFDKADRLTSVQVGMGGVWLLCPPQLLFIPDKNRDDVPDGPPEVVLDGFDLKTSTHTVANGLKWGPDGWLYGRQGILGTSKVGVPGAPDSERAVLNTGVWRYHPTRHVAEVVMHGMTNPWGFDYDPFGEMFVINTVIGHLWHVIPGACTERMSGSDFNPYAYQLIPQTADHVHWTSGEVWTDVRKGMTDRTSAAGGGHAHTGLMIYQGDNWPAEYRGRIYTLNIHGRRLNCDILSRTAVGYVASHGADMCLVKDPWFRGMDVISGADGGVFLADWSDTGECHEMGGVHRTSGRIYRLTYGDQKARPKVDVFHASNDELAAFQSYTNDWFSRRARLMLQERAATGDLKASECREPLMQLFSDSKDPVVRQRAMWALYLSGCVDDKWLVEQLHHADEHVRVWAIRLLMDQQPAGQGGLEPLAKEFTKLAEKDTSGLVLLYLAAAMQKMPVDSRLSLGQAIATRSEKSFAEDRTLSIMLWLGLEPYLAKHSDSALAIVERTTFPLMRENIAHRLTGEIDDAMPVVEKLLTVATANPKLKPDILRGCAAALNGRKETPVPENWKDLAPTLAKNSAGDVSDSLDILGIAFGDQRTIASLQKQLETAGENSDTRKRALKLLLTAHPNGFNVVLKKMIRDPDLATDAIHGLAAYEDRDTPQLLLDAYGKLNVEQRGVVISTLASRRKYASALLDALEAKKLTASDISAVQARQLMSLGDSSITDRVRVLWGDARQTSGEKREAMSRMRAVLIPTVAKADLENGKAIYTKTCANCHVLFGQGAKIGPELTGSNRKNLEYLLENVLDPSAVVPAEFRATVFILSDGRVLNGIIREQNDQTITIETAEGKQTIDKKQVDETSVSDKSLMPDGLLQPLSPTQVRDLMGYLMSD